MKSIIDELYDLDLFHLTDTESKDGEYKLCLDRLVKLENDILNTYPEIKELLEDYQSADIDLHCISNRNEFRMGVRLGAQLVLDMIKSIE